VLLGLGTERHIDGKHALASLALGLEASIRLGVAIGDSHAQSGWHTTGTMGTVGAALTAARLVRLDAARNNGDLTRITDGLGSRWETPAIGFKPYASGAATHATIDAALALRAELGLKDLSTPDEVDVSVRNIERLHFTAHEGAARLPRGREISEPFEAKFSIYNVAAIVLVRGRGGPGEYNAAVLTDPTIAYLRDLIELTGDPTVPNGTATVVADLRDGKHIEIHIDYARGTVNRPLDDAALRRKLFDAAEGILDHGQIGDLADEIEHIESTEDVGTIMGLATL
jgi:2-methylcitrate dehydratase PrpD